MTTDSDSNGATLHPWVRRIPLMMIAIAALAFVNSLGNPYVFDDARIVRTCSTLSCLWPLPPRIVANLTFLLNGLLCGPNPACYRVVNIAIHLIAALLLYGIVRRTLMLPRFRAQYGSAAPWLAAVTATVWAVHPLQTESVIYVCQRYESLMGMLYLLALYCFIRGCASHQHPRRWHDAALIACLLGMGTKGVMVTAPLMILLYDSMFLAGPSFGPLRSRWKAHAALFATVGVAIALTSLYRENSVESYADGTRITAYLLTQFRVVTHYLRLAVCPYPLCLDYGWGTVGGLKDVVFPMVLILTLMGATAWALWRRRPAGYLGAWFFVILAPTSSVIPIDDVIFEHRMYLPLAGLVVMAVIAGYTWFDQRCTSAEMQRGWGRRMAAVAVLFILILAALTALRNRDYSSELRLWGDVVFQEPDNLRARNDLAVALCEAGSSPAAQLHFDYVIDRTAQVPDFSKLSANEAQSAIPNNSPRFNRFRALANLGCLAQNSGRTEEAIVCYIRALRLIPDSRDVLRGLRQALQAQGVEAHAVEREILKLLGSASTD